MGTGSTGRKLTSIEDEVRVFVSGLPMAELMNGGLIRLAGASGYFNPSSLLEVGWLKGKITAEEYRSGIDYINSCALQTQLETRNRIWPNETHEREKMKAETGQAAVQQLNSQYKSVRFTYQQSFEKVEYIPIYDPDLMSHICVLSERGRYLTTRCYLYININ